MKKGAAIAPFSPVRLTNPGEQNVKKMMIAIVAGALCLATALSLLAASGKSASKQQIAHGEYLVKVIGQCGECHTPTDEKGEFVPGKWLQGTKVTSDNKLRVLEHGKVVAEIPNHALTDDAPVYKRPLARWEPSVSREMPED